MKKQTCQIMRVAHNFSARNVRELSLTKGDEVAVIEENEAGWWRGYNSKSKKTGWFPFNYCEITKKTTEIEVVIESDSALLIPPDSEINKTEANPEPKPEPEKSEINKPEEKEESSESNVKTQIKVLQQKIQSSEANAEDSVKVPPKKPIAKTPPTPKKVTAPPSGSAPAKKLAPVTKANPTKPYLQASPKKLTSSPKTTAVPSPGKKAPLKASGSPSVAPGAVVSAKLAAKIAELGSAALKSSTATKKSPRSEDIPRADPKADPKALQKSPRPAVESPRPKLKRATSTSTTPKKGRPDRSSTPSPIPSRSTSFRNLNETTAEKKQVEELQNAQKALTAQLLENQVLKVKLEEVGKEEMAKNIKEQLEQMKSVPTSMGESKAAFFTNFFQCIHIFEYALAEKEILQQKQEKLEKEAEDLKQELHDAKLRLDITQKEKAQLHNELLEYKQERSAPQSTTPQEPTTSSSSTLIEPIKPTEEISTEKTKEEISIEKPTEEPLATKSIEEISTEKNQLKNQQNQKKKFQQSY